MFDPFIGWTRIMAAGASVAETSLRAFETAIAANAVIVARMPIIEAAMRSPLTGDHREWGRMVPEKVEAFSRAGSTTVSAWWTAHSAWMDHLQHLHATASRGRPPTAAELERLGERNIAAMLEAFEAATRLASNTLKPLHAKATSNARRLSGKRKQTRR